MKIGLNQPNGFTTNFAQDHSKYLDVRTPTEATIEHKRGQFEPYVFHAGTVVAVAGPDYVIVAGDTRLSKDYDIVHRNMSKLTQLTDKTILAASGMYADYVELQKMLKVKLLSYEYKMGRLPTTESIAHLISKTLYGRRFFPYYTFNLVAGLDKDGRGVVYGYDAIGSYGPDKALSQGSGGHMIIPYLDSEFVGYNNPIQDKKAPKSIEEAVEIVYKAFVGAAERDIYTGDSCEIWVLDKSGTRK